MDIIELNNENVSEYESVLEPDISESIGRMFYRGIAAVGEDNSPAGAMVWEYKNMEDEADTDAEIYLINSEGGDALASLLSEFDSQIKGSEVTMSFLELEDISEEEKKGLKDDGFEIKEGESRDIELTVEDVKSLMALKKKLGDNVVGLDELMELQFMQGVTNCLFKGKKGLVEDLEYLEKDWFDETASSCVITDGKVSGMFLIHRFSSGVLMPVLFHASGPDSKIDLLSMIAFSARRAVENYPSDTRIVIRRHNAMVKALAAKLFAGRTGREAISGCRG
ncbi:MAG: hypothetical protein IKO61_09435 [Lachnospiraceae bacterium]|nr:hypothetical protein [Lachnospiraceae bacterium]